MFWGAYRYMGLMWGQTFQMKTGWFQIRYKIAKRNFENVMAVSKQNFESDHLL